MTILLLGGTRDAIKIGEELQGDYIYSIVGVTDNPATPAGARVHMGGFSGGGDSVIGLQKFVRDNNITTIINATHPYAQKITQTVNQITGIKIIRYLRKVWQKPSPNDWIDCANADEIKNKLADFTGNVFFALGAKTIHKYSDLKCCVVSRSVVATAIPNVECIVDKGPYTMVNEQELFDKYKFKALVCKNSGGLMNYNKIQIAIANNIPVFMLSRPLDSSKIIITDIKLINNYL